MPDVHVDSMIFQYPFFCSFFSLCFLVFLQSLCVWQFVQGQLHFGSLICLVFSSWAWVGFKTLPTTEGVWKKAENNQSLFSVVMNLLCFDYDKCWCCLDCFGLFLCTEWILFSGVKFLISRCVVFYRIQVLLPCHFTAVFSLWRQNFNLSYWFYRGFLTRLLE